MITRYIGPFFDSSGYAQAARGNIVSMVRAGIDMTLESVSFEHQYANNVDADTIRSYLNSKGYWDTNIIHLTPENWPRFLQRDKYNIGYTAWETSRLPVSWVPLINQANEVWVPSKFNKLVFEQSGITIPIKVVPHAIAPAKVIPSEPTDTDYKFYSIFQWTERKNPIGLLTAYLTEFSSNESVVLYLKTYHMGWNDKQQNIIKMQVRELKEQLGRESYPKIQFIGNLLSEDDICKLHTIGDCLVLPHKGEGFGIVPATAMSYGRPVIATNWGGNLEFMNDQNSYLINGRMEPVNGMPWTIYTSDQMWCEPDTISLQLIMRTIFENQQEAIATGLTGAITVKNKLSYETIGSLIKELLVQNGRI